MQIKATKENPKYMESTARGHVCPSSRGRCQQVCVSEVARYCRKGGEGNQESMATNRNDNCTALL